MNHEALGAKISELLTRKVDEFLLDVRGMLLGELGLGEPIALPEARPTRPRALLNAPAAAEVSTSVRKRRAPRKSVEREPAEKSSSKGAQDLTGFPIGSFVGVKPTKKRYYGQIVWEFRCKGCGAEARIPSQNAKRLKRQPKCKCTAAPKENRSPKEDRPTSAPSKAPAPAVRPSALTGAELTLFNDAAPMVTAAATKLLRKYGSKLTHEELVSHGQEGLLEAVRRFDASRGVPFRGFAHPRVVGAMLDGIRGAQPLSRRAHERRKPTAEDDGTTTLAVAEREARAHHSTTDAPAPTSEDLVRKAEQLRQIHAALKDLDAVEAELVRRHYFEHERFDVVADELGISKSWASRLKDRAIEALRGKLNGKAPPAPPKLAPAPPAAKPDPFFTRRPFTDMTGETVATFKCGGKTKEQRADGSIVWLFRCVECGAERKWTRTDVNRIRQNHKGLRCECQGGSAHRGRPLKGATPKFLQPPTEEKSVDELDQDELEAAVLDEFERDRALPRFRADDERTGSRASLLDEPEDEDETEGDEEADRVEASEEDVA